MRKTVPYLLEYTSFNSQIVLVSDEAFETASCIAPQNDISEGFKSGDLGGHCAFSVIWRRFTRRHERLVQRAAAQSHRRLSEAATPFCSSQLHYL